MKITLIIGTNRPDSNTRKIATEIEGIYSELGTPVQVLDLAHLPPEIFEPTHYWNPPASFMRFIDQVQGSAGLHFVTPEYNGSIPGVLKYFMDMLPLPESFAGHAAAITSVSAGQWGGMHAADHLQSIFIHLQGHVFPTRIFIPKVDDVLSEAGQITDPGVLKRLRAQSAGFIDFVEKVRSAKLA